MDIKKLVLVIIFFTSALFLWEEWQKEQLPQSSSNNIKEGQGEPRPSSPGSFVTQAPKNEPTTKLQDETPVPG